MPENPIEIRIDNQKVNDALLDIARRGENLRPLMKNIAGIMAHSTEENFKAEGRPEKWVVLSEKTIKQRKKTGHYPGQILQVTGQLASSISTSPFFILKVYSFSLLAIFISLYFNIA